MKVDTNHKCKEGSMIELRCYDAADIIGAPFPVFLDNGVYERKCPECGKVLGHVISKPKELIAAVAILRAFKPKKLSGSEIKFLRKSLSLKSKELAEEISLSPEALSRFENDKQPMSETYEKLLRAAVCLRHIDEARGLEVDVEGLFSMKISSVTDVEKPLSLSLRMESMETSNHQNGGDPHGEDKMPSKWLLLSQNKVA